MITIDLIIVQLGKTWYWKDIEELFFFSPCGCGDCVVVVVVGLLLFSLSLLLLLLLSLLQLLLLLLMVMMMLLLLLLLLFGNLTCDNILYPHLSPGAHVWEPAKQHYFLPMISPKGNPPQGYKICTNKDQVFMVHLLASHVYHNESERVKYIFPNQWLKIYPPWN